MHLKTGGEQVVTGDCVHFMYFCLLWYVTVLIVFRLGSFVCVDIV